MVELLVVISIIGILMALVVGIAGSVQGGAAEAQAKAQMADLMSEIEKYNSDEGGYPAGWSAFGSWYDARYPNTIYTLTEGGPNNPVDPWGQPYVYQPQPNNPFIYFIGSYGPNTRDDGGEVDDITNLNGALQ